MCKDHGKGPTMWPDNEDVVWLPILEANKEQSSDKEDPAGCRPWNRLWKVRLESRLQRGEAKECRRRPSLQSTTEGWVGLRGIVDCFPNHRMWRRCRLSLLMRILRGTRSQGVFRDGTHLRRGQCYVSTPLEYVEQSRSSGKGAELRRRGAKLPERIGRLI